jgi:hypothetical protein
MSISEAREREAINALETICAKTDLFERVEKEGKIQRRDRSLAGSVWDAVLGTNSRPQDVEMIPMGQSPVTDTGSSV